MEPLNEDTVLYTDYHVQITHISILMKVTGNDADDLKCVRSGVKKNNPHCHKNGNVCEPTKCSRIKVAAVQSAEILKLFPHLFFLLEENS